MTNTGITLYSVSCLLANGRAVFNHLDHHFDQRKTGLIGRNGCGKSTLARIMAGLQQPTSGHCSSAGYIHYLAQQVCFEPHETLASLAGVEQQLAALQRIEAGSSAEQDFEILADQWDLPTRLQQQLEQYGLSHLQPATPARTLSGGEAMQIALIGARLSNPDWLILDEPGNHLDYQHRQALLQQLKDWPGGLIVVSHDRQLLNAMECIVELSPTGLTRYGGNFSFYQQAKADQQQLAMAQLQHCKTARKRQQDAAHQQLQRQQKRASQGAKQHKTSNQSKILLDRQQQRSELSSAALQQQLQARQQQLDQQVKQAADKVAAEQAIHLHPLQLATNSQRLIAELTDVVLPNSATNTPLSLRLYGQQRLAITGPNGCGKSTLLKLIHGRLPATAGHCDVRVHSQLIDQHLSLLNPKLGTLEQLQTVNRTRSESELRMRLAQLGLDADHILLPTGLLSGGERLKAALACVLYSDQPAPLLLLDEPTNHLDLPSITALETLLRQYPGCLIVVSHDEVFLGNLELQQRLEFNPEGWVRKPFDHICTWP
ncbi:ABC-F family ATP-binding cassette domain-containing protein [Oceanobacter mangrovi]|uniref:ABC-F family ATP-binding cassette domain-containing protein n=1 Tax=Oceanobacter mangrovi TaxID=2862510 RepID=UPI001C8DD95B|nr:ABC-F family ATP-binding cassette domain-containing protein [Oceanobacter mangrovi]